MGIAVAVLFAVGKGFIPAGFGAFVEGSGDIVFVDVVDRCAMHADHVEERLAVDVEAGAGASGHDGRDARRSTNSSQIGLGQTLLRRLGDWNQGRAEFGYAA